MVAEALEVVAVLELSITVAAAMAEITIRTAAHMMQTQSICQGTRSRTRQQEAATGDKLFTCGM